MKFLCVSEEKKFFLVIINSLDVNGIGDEGCVALGEALKVNKTLQTLR